MVNKTLYGIFRAGSKTYFYSSLFFPKKVRDDVFALYGFVRLADDFVDAVPQKKEEFYSLRERYFSALAGEVTGDVVVDSFVSLVWKKDLDPSWVNAFLDSMESDLYWRGAKSLEEIESYMYGSAEAVGLMMARILGLPEGAYPYARLLGRSMQYINFIRDMSEDLSLGRNYFPRADFSEYAIDSLKPEDVASSPEAFKAFVHKQLSYYDLWQTEAEKGFDYIPKRYLVPIKTASEMYKWTAEQIRKDPLVVYRMKVKPSILLIMSNISHNAFSL